MLHDAAKMGDVEIPVFCYEPKLGDPVGACRMCLVEIEGMPKLQTSCSTPIRDGMVVYTQTDRVKEAQNAVVEFLLVNHPLDCPVCDKGGECPLQDIAMGWGPGKSRFTDPKRHFQKPLELSPLVAIDRERCILCYRCVRFSQEVAEDEQLQLLERGDKSFVGTFDERPYIAPFHGNIIELCPVGALTSYTYRFRARPWDIEDAGLGLHALPEPVQRRVHRPRRAGPARAGPRQRRGRRRLALRQGPLRLPDVQLGGADHPADGPRRGRQPQPDRLGRGGQAGRRTACEAPARTPPRWSAAAPPTRRAGWSSGSCARRRLLQRRLLRQPCRPRPARRALAPGAGLADGGPRPRRRDPGDRRRSAARDADPRSAHPQGRAARPREADGRLRAARPPSTAARPRPSATRPATRPPSSARWRAPSAPTDTTPRGRSRRKRPRSPRCCATLPTRRSSGASGSGGTPAPSRRSMPARARWRCTSGSARACSRSPRSRTGAACARSAACPGRSRAWSPSGRPGQRRDQGRPRGPRARRDAARQRGPGPHPSRLGGLAQGAGRVTSSSRSRASRTSRPGSPTSSSRRRTYAEKEGTVTHPDGRLQRLRRNVPLPEGMIPGWRFLAAVAAELGGGHRRRVARRRLRRALERGPLLRHA